MIIDLLTLPADIYNALLCGLFAGVGWHAMNLVGSWLKHRKSLR